MLACETGRSLLFFSAFLPGNTCLESASLSQSRTPPLMQGMVVPPLFLCLLFPLIFSLSALSPFLSIFDFALSCLTRPLPSSS